MGSGEENTIKHHTTSTFHNRAMTINKAQGQTLEFVGIQLETQPFAHGQLYVALSRVGSPDRIKV
jgi:ATP-dependent exoDNAse (exonuclease V) alpha subunit